MHQDNETSNTVANSEQTKYAKRSKRLIKWFDKSNNLEEKELIVELINFYDSRLEDYYV